MEPWSWPWGTIPIREKELKELEEKAENWDEIVKHAQDSLDAEGGDEPPCVDLREWVDALRRNLTCCAGKLGAVRDHMKSYPDETDDKYLIERHHPSPAGSHFFNSVLFLTHLETWHKQLKEILEAESP